MNNAMVQSSALLLRHVSGIIEKYNDFYKRTGLKYNIFQAAGITEREVIMCRVLAPAKRTEEKVLSRCCI
jgi:hypothetical protein